jgi:mono/diheme cytochrome c family protein
MVNSNIIQRRALFLVFLLAITANAFATSATSEGAFSKEQAQQGEHLFAAHCSQCHTQAQVADLAFERWNGQALGDLFERVTKTMPPEGEKLNGQQYLDILASIFIQKGFTAGLKPALMGDAAWRQIVVQADDRASEKTESQTLEWTAYRGNLLSQGYSPARQIDRENVGHLKIAWRWSARNFGPTPEFRNATTPLMINGVLYFTAGITRDVVAVDAGTGETLWIWRPRESQERFERASQRGRVFS